MGSLRGMLAAPALIALLCGSGGIAVAQVPTPAVSWKALEDVPPTTDGPLPLFHDYSWRSFIALNWPAATGAANRGQPDRTKVFGDVDGPRVWATWKSRYEIFQPGGATPSAWESYDGENPCGPGVSNDVVTLRSFRLFADFNQPTAAGDRGNPLVAQNRTYVRYEVRVNQPQFKSIVDRGWYIASNLPEQATAKAFNEGSTAVKAAWRILTDSDTPAIRARYYVVRDAQVYDVRSEKCVKADIALVGLHIATKTTHRPQWIWSTFEHVDNVPGLTTEPGPPAGVPYSFHNGGPPSTLSPEPAPPAISIANPPAADPEPMQVVRKQPIRPETMAMNEAYWSLPEIKNTVWRNYMLVMTQWPTDTLVPSPLNDGVPKPSHDGFTLANTTMETYFQLDDHSCMRCHHRANTQGRDFIMFVTMDAFRPQVPTLAGGPAVAPDRSADPVVKSLNDFFDAAHKK
jgi:hypothetical protein